MKPEELKPFLEFMKEHGLIYLAVEKPAFKLVLAREGASGLAAPPEKILESAAKETQELANLVYLKSPLVGTFYRAPLPESPPFVEVGSPVKKDDTLCIVEAMKVMNQVKSEVNGKILEIQVENGQPVEFGQPMFLIVKK
ncbi:MAG: Biotin carboxyl carrier protein of acetyl-CoA carboxylase [candidate division TA06 bacterium ADurb.Bin417]|uniref:Biotin carboxyl carrier protein of acetyl-CoA carboxylase n=1 Tax=candidate division TA06 bacterium ADurb.Bin417 TaxID=1852828 RepID=A0A1V5MKE6_UNCT6|nr:MAG: Biotin carboxyl carrier protein of acetyl-CoA carboxylase [candidate division TA06 bacterium ADurb.Bin417]